MRRDLTMHAYSGVVALGVACGVRYPLRQTRICK